MQSTIDDNQREKYLLERALDDEKNTSLALQDELDKMADQVRCGAHYRHPVHFVWPLGF